jgi:hypothetical protein
MSYSKEIRHRALEELFTENGNLLQFQWERALDSLERLVIKGRKKTYKHQFHEASQVLTAIADKTPIMLIVVYNKERTRARMVPCFEIDKDNDRILIGTTEQTCGANPETVGSVASYVAELPIKEYVGPYLSNTIVIQANHGLNRETAPLAIGFLVAFKLRQYNQQAYEKVRQLQKEIDG